MTNDLAVVTVTYSPGEYLDDFLASLPTATHRRVSVVMADNGSTDGAPEAAVARYADDDRFAQVTLLRTGGNIGYGGAINRAVAALPNDVDSEFVIVANPDVRWEAGAIDALLAAAARRTDAGSLGPQIREPDGTVYPSARRVPNLTSGIGHALAGLVWKSNPWTTAYRQDGDYANERDAGWLSGSCLLLRRKAFDQISGFDDRYFMYMEDVDLGDRLGRAGWRNVFVPDAVVMHAKGHAAGRHPELMLPAHHRSAFRFQADRHPRWWQAPLRWALWVGLSARSAVVVALAQRERRKEHGE